MLARWCPAQRWREPGLRLLCGTVEGVPGYCRLRPLAGRDGDREILAGTRQELSTVAGRAVGPARSSGDVPAWRGGGGAKGPACPRFVHLVNQGPWEESRGRAEAVRQAV